MLSTHQTKLLSHTPPPIPSTFKIPLTFRRLPQVGFKNVFGRDAGVLLQKERVRNLTVSSFTDGFLLSRVASKSSCIAGKLVYEGWCRKRHNREYHNHGIIRKTFKGIKNNKVQNKSENIEEIISKKEIPEKIMSRIISNFVYNTLQCKLTQIIIKR